jgi:putative transposase
MWSGRFNSRQEIEAWRVDCNQQRPHGSLGHLTPNEYARQRQDPEAAFL